MADEEKDKDKQQYSYRPEIEYQDTYESDYSNKGYQTVTNSDKEDTSFGEQIIENINQTFNDVSKIIPLLPAQLQTSINGVYKPILDTWAGINSEPYPEFIPDPDGIIYEPGGGTDPEPGEDEFTYPIPPDLPLPTPPYRPNKDYPLDNDGIWDVDVPVKIVFPTIDPSDIIKKEYIKNVADLFSYYVNRLKDIIYRYYSEKIMATYAKKKNTEGNLVSKTTKDVEFLFLPITDKCNDVEANSKHLFDSSIAMEEKSKQKLCFLENAFPVEQTLFHLKNFNTIYQLRLRYASIDDSDGKDNIESMSNRILKGMKIGYDQKYDVAFAALYKYLNSSLDILEDTINTELAGLKARRTLLEKGGIKK